MKTKTLFAVCTALLMVACSQKQSVVQVPVSTIDVEHLNGDIDYDMDVTGLSLGDLRVLRHAPAARQGFPFKDAYLRGVYETTTWYDSLVWKFDESLDFSSVKERGDESWRDYYYRATDELKVLKYTPEEEAFMERLKLREDELQKLNFDADDDGIWKKPQAAVSDFAAGQECYLYNVGAARFYTEGEILDIITGKEGKP